MGISTHFINHMHLEKTIDYDKRRVLNAVFNYLMGVNNYRDTVVTMQDLGFHQEFVDAIRSLTEDLIKYVFRLRIKLKAKLMQGVHRLDRWYLRMFNSKFWTKRIGTFFDTSKVTVVKSVPSFTYTLTSYRPLLTSVASSVYKVNRWNTSVDYEDLYSVLSYTMYQKYATYVFNIGHNRFNLKVFFNLLTQGVKSKRIDIIRSIMKTSNLDRRMCSFDELQGLNLI